MWTLLKTKLSFTDRTKEGHGALKNRWCNAVLSQTIGDSYTAQLVRDNVAGIVHADRDLGRVMGSTPYVGVGAFP